MLLCINPQQEPKTYHVLRLRLRFYGAGPQNRTDGMPVAAVRAREAKHDPALIATILHYIDQHASLTLPCCRK
jgi:hypothetical protein